MLPRELGVAGGDVGEAEELPGHQAEAQPGTAGHAVPVRGEGVHVHRGEEAGREVPGGVAGLAQGAVQQQAVRGEHPAAFPGGEHRGGAHVGGLQGDHQVHRTRGVGQGLGEVAHLEGQVGQLEALAADLDGGGAVVVADDPRLRELPGQAGGGVAQAAAQLDDGLGLDGQVLGDERGDLGIAVLDQAVLRLVPGLGRTVQEHVLVLLHHAVVVGVGLLDQDHVHVAGAARLGQASGHGVEGPQDHGLHAVDQHLLGQPGAEPRQVAPQEHPVRAKGQMELLALLGAVVFVVGHVHEGEDEGGAGMHERSAKADGETAQVGQLQGGRGPVFQADSGLEQAAQGLVQAGGGLGRAVQGQGSFHASLAG